MKIIAILFILVLSLDAVADIDVKVISPKYCRQGEHVQPQSSFAIYVFCDDALGTNIAVFLKELGAPFEGDYELGKRFWQGQEWAYDVTSYSWLQRNKLLIATSAIYGSGSVYLLDLEKKSFRVLKKIDGSVIELVSVSKSIVTIRYETTNGKYENDSINM